MILEAAGFGVGTLGGAGIKLVTKGVEALIAGNTAKREAEENRHAEYMADVGKARDFALAFKGGVWARRFIVLTVFSYLFIFPYAVTFTGDQVHYVYLEEGSGIFAWLFGMGDGTKVITMTGFVILPFQRLLASTVAGFYFGAGIVK
jgi:hypothetical protein